MEENIITGTLEELVNNCVPGTIITFYDRKYILAHEMHEGYIEEFFDESFSLLEEDYEI